MKKQENKQAKKWKDLPMEDQVSLLVKHVVSEIKRLESESESGMEIYELSEREEDGECYTVLNLDYDKRDKCSNELHVTIWDNGHVNFKETDGDRNRIQEHVHELMPSGRYRGMDIKSDRDYYPVIPGPVYKFSKPKR